MIKKSDLVKNITQKMNHLISSQRVKPSVSTQILLHQREKSRESLRAVMTENKRYKEQTAKMLRFSKQRLKPGQVSINDIVPKSHVSGMRSAAAIKSKSMSRNMPLALVRSRENMTVEQISSADAISLYFPTNKKEEASQSDTMNHVLSVNGIVSERPIDEELAAFQPAEPAAILAKGPRPKIQRSDASNQVLKSNQRAQDVKVDPTESYGASYKTAADLSIKKHMAAKSYKAVMNAAYTSSSGSQSLSQRGPVKRHRINQPTYCTNSHKLSDNMSSVNFKKSSAVLLTSRKAPSLAEAICNLPIGQTTGASVKGGTL